MPDETVPDQIPPGFKLRHMLMGHENIISCVAWSPDGRALTSGSRDGTIRLWDAATGQLLHTLEGNSSTLLDVTWSPDGNKVAAGAADTRVWVWDTATGQSLRTLRGYGGAINSVAWSPNGLLFAAGGPDRTIWLWDVELSKIFRILERNSRAVVSIAWSPDGRTLAVLVEGGSLLLWDVDSRQEHYIEKRSGPVSGVAWSPDGRALAFAGEYGKILLLEPASRQTLVALEGHTSDVKSLAFSFDGLLLASTGLDGTLRLWRCDTWENIAVLGGGISNYPPLGLAFHPKAHVLATLGEKYTAVRVWELDFNLLLGAARERDDVLYTTAKIALVGDSGAGKTGLGWRLAHGEFKEHPSTHGQQFWVIDEWGTTRGDGTQCEAVLWDLAGQPDYRLVHALFLDDVDLALVLFDPTNRQEPLKGVEYWFKHLARERKNGRSRRVILVGARADRGVPTLLRPELEEFCKRHGVEAYVGTSALTGEGLEELLGRVRSSIVWDEMPATVTTKTFKRVKEFVLELKEKGERREVLVSPEELRARLKATDAEWEFTDTEMMTAVRHLANHGYVSVLRGSSGEETILLAPDMLANLAASFVLEARRNEKGLGALEESRVLEGRYEFPELKALEKEERDVLLDAAVVLFIEHNLCFRETLGTQTLLIFPALINQKRPQVEESEIVDDYSYRVTGAVENVYAALVVQLGHTNTFTRTNQWQNQAEYETARGDVCGFRQIDEREGETELVLYHARDKPGARPLFQGLFEEFLRGRDVSVTKFPPVPCPNCGYRQQRGEVVKRIGEGKGFLFCGECGIRLVLPREGERVGLSAVKREQLDREQERARRRTTFESALVRVKALAVRDEGKESPSCFISYAWGDDAHERWVHGLSRDLENAGVRVTLDNKDNPKIGGNVARFIALIGESDFVVAVGTPEYQRKYENRGSETGSVVASEVDLIHLRLVGATEEEKATVLPILLEGSERDSLPPLMRGKVYADFRPDDLYFPSLFDLILTLYGIPFGHPAVADLRDAMRGRLQSS